MPETEPETSSSGMETVRAAVALPTEEVLIDASAGVPPCDTVPRSLGLYYPIELNQQGFTALWDPGAGASFVSSAVVQKLQLTPVLLSRPISLEVWDGPGAVISHQVVVKNVCFGTKQGQWTFLVDERPPHEVVAGLDFCRAWFLTVNPCQ